MAVRGALPATEHEKLPTCLPLEVQTAAPRNTEAVHAAAPIAASVHSEDNEHYQRNNHVRRLESHFEHREIRAFVANRERDRSECWRQLLDLGCVVPWRKRYLHEVALVLHRVASEQRDSGASGSPSCAPEVARDVTVVNGLPVGRDCRRLPCFQASPLNRERHRHVVHGRQVGVTGEPVRLHLHVKVLRPSAVENEVMVPAPFGLWH